jgi:hypothetical protein
MFDARVKRSAGSLEPFLRVLGRVDWALRTRSVRATFGDPLQPEHDRLHPSGAAARPHVVTARRLTVPFLTVRPGRDDIGHRPLSCGDGGYVDQVPPKGDDLLH